MAPKKIYVSRYSIEQAKLGFPNGIQYLPFRAIVDGDEYGCASVELLGPSKLVMDTSVDPSVWIETEHGVILDGALF